MGELRSRNEHYSQAGFLRSVLRTSSPLPTLRSAQLTQVPLHYPFTGGCEVPICNYYQRGPFSPISRPEGRQVLRQVGASHFFDLIQRELRGLSLYPSMPINPRLTEPRATVGSEPSVHRTCVCTCMQLTASAPPRNLASGAPGRVFSVPISTVPHNSRQRDQMTVQVGTWGRRVIASSLHPGYSFKN